MGQYLDLRGTTVNPLEPPNGFTSIHKNAYNSIMATLWIHIWPRQLSNGLIFWLQQGIHWSHTMDL